MKRGAERAEGGRRLLARGVGGGDGGGEEEGGAVRGIPEGPGRFSDLGALDG